jgi:hypothetical protein
MPRLYLTWFIEPEDPHYWDFFSIDGLVVSMKSIMNMRQHRGVHMLTRLLSEGFRRFYGYNGPLIVDSMTQPLHAVGGLQVSHLSQAQVLYTQYVLGSDILVHRDYPILHVKDHEVRVKLFSRNLINAEAALRFGESLGREVMLVVQGWNLDTYVKCVQYYRDLGARYIGVGSLVPHKGDASFIINVVRAVRDVLGGRVHLHLFGVGGLNMLREVASLVDSIDVSTPAIAAGKKEVLIPSGNGIIRVKVNSMSGISMLKERLESTNDSIESLLIGRILNAESLKEENRSVMLYNAYVLTRHKALILGS